MSSLNIVLYELSDTHVSVYTFSFSYHFYFSYSSACSMIHGESDHVSYMTDKSSCPIYEVKSFLGLFLCRAHCSRIYPCI